MSAAWMFLAVIGGGVVAGLVAFAVLVLVGALIEGLREGSGK